MAINITEEKALIPAHQFFEKIQNLACFSKSQLAHLCGVNRTKIQYWEDTGLIVEPPEWDWLGKSTESCTDYSLKRAKFIFAMTCHYLGKMQPREAREAVLKNGNSADKWRKNYENEWQSAFRSGFLLRFADAIEIMNLIVPIRITDYYLEDWVSERYLEEFIPRPRDNKLDLIDLYQMHAVYIVATKARQDSLGPKQRIGDYAANHFAYANRNMQQQFCIDNKIESDMLIESDFKRKLFPKPLEEESIETIADKIVKCLSASFPECLSAESIIEAMELEDLALDIIDALLESRAIEKIKCHVGFGYRVLPEYLKK
ncbi:MAG: hypothetical protein WCI57_02640 [Candidatus Berkelbacteria bacterium]